MIHQTYLQPTSDDEGLIRCTGCSWCIAVQIEDGSPIFPPGSKPYVRINHGDTAVQHSFAVGGIELSPPKIEDK